MMRREVDVKVVRINKNEGVIVIIWSRKWGLAGLGI